jgi:hypothetical protein
MSGDKIASEDSGRDTTGGEKMLFFKGLRWVCIFWFVAAFIAGFALAVIGGKY